uniref:Uncharacterized protein n=1 Tax=Tetradesmus obliquus TaxID=3088 RepID=A0A383WN39_TETOB|eukprot:jgi/Sobl393_1/16327/SZX65686.1
MALQLPRSASADAAAKHKQRPVHAAGAAAVSSPMATTGVMAVNVAAASQQELTEWVAMLRRCSREVHTIKLQCNRPSGSARAAAGAARAARRTSNSSQPAAAAAAAGQAVPYTSQQHRAAAAEAAAKLASEKLRAPLPDALCKMASSSSGNLRQLELCVKFPLKVYEQLAAALAGNASLEVLSLAGSCCGDAALAALLPALIHHPKLQVLELPGCCLSDASAGRLAALLKAQAAAAAQQAWMAGLRGGPAAAAAAAAQRQQESAGAGGRQQQGLRVLDLAQNQITDAALPGLAAALGDEHCSLKHLSLAANQLPGAAAAAAALLAALQDGDPTGRNFTIDLRGNAGVNCSSDAAAEEAPTIPAVGVWAGMLSWSGPAVQPAAAAAHRPASALTARAGRSRSSHVQPRLTAGVQRNGGSSSAAESGSKARQQSAVQQAAAAAAAPCGRAPAAAAAAAAAATAILRMARNSEHAADTARNEDEQAEQRRVLRQEQQQQQQQQQQAVSDASCSKGCSTHDDTWQTSQQQQPQQDSYSYSCSASSSPSSSSSGDSCGSWRSGHRKQQQQQQQQPAAAGSPAHVWACSSVLPDVVATVTVQTSESAVGAGSEFDAGQVHPASTADALAVGAASAPHQDCQQRRASQQHHCSYATELKLSKQQQQQQYQQPGHADNRPPAHAAPAAAGAVQCVPELLQAVLQQQQMLQWLVLQQQQQQQQQQPTAVDDGELLELATTMRGLSEQVTILEQLYGITAPAAAAAQSDATPKAAGRNIHTKQFQEQAAAAVHNAAAADVRARAAAPAWPQFGSSRVDQCNAGRQQQQPQHSHRHCLDGFDDPGHSSCGGGSSSSRAECSSRAVFRSEPWPQQQAGNGAAAGFGVDWELVEVAQAAAGAVQCAPEQQQQQPAGFGVDWDVVDNISAQLLTLHGLS